MSAANRLRLFRIMHSTNTRDSGDYPSKHWTKAKAIAAILDGGYVLRASVRARDLDDAYQRSQNVHGSWFRNRGVTPTRQPTQRCRSTMIGDIIVDDHGCHWIVARVGFDPLDVPPPVL